MEKLLQLISENKKSARKKEKQLKEESTKIEEKKMKENDNIGKILPEKVHRSVKNE